MLYANCREQLLTLKIKYLHLKKGSSASVKNLDHDDLLILDELPDLVQKEHNSESESDNEDDDWPISPLFRMTILLKIS